jgi:hypothetical protein
LNNSTSKKLLEKFDAALDRSFRYETAEKAFAEMVMERERVLAALGEEKMRLPNDLRVEKNLEMLTRSADEYMLSNIDDAAERIGLYAHRGMDRTPAANQHDILENSLDA